MPSNQILSGADTYFRPVSIVPKRSYLGQLGHAAAAMPEAPVFILPTTPLPLDEGSRIPPKTKRKHKPLSKREACHAARKNRRLTLALQLSGVLLLAALIGLFVAKTW